MKQLENIQSFIKNQNLVNTLENGDKSIIEKLEKNGSKVFYVANVSMKLIGYELVNMTSYCLYFKEDYQSKSAVNDFIENFNDGYVMTYTVNHTWGIEEYGTIAFAKQEGPNGNYLVRLQ